MRRCHGFVCEILVYEDLCAWYYLAAAKAYYVLMIRSGSLLSVPLA